MLKDVYKMAQILIPIKIVIFSGIVTGTLCLVLNMYCSPIVNGFSAWSVSVSHAWLCVTNHLNTAHREL